jgi:hypothetical protein
MRESEGIANWLPWNSAFEMILIDISVSVRPDLSGLMFQSED